MSIRSRCQRQLMVYSAQPVSEVIVSRTEAEMGESIPSEVKGVGKCFRQYLGNLLIGRRKSVKQMGNSASTDAEDAASEF